MIKRKTKDFYALRYSQREHIFAWCHHCTYLQLCYWQDGTKSKDPDLLSQDCVHQATAQELREQDRHFAAVAAKSGPIRV